jgi:hypothetical protein
MFLFSGCVIISDVFYDCLTGDKSKSLVPNIFVTVRRIHLPYV